MLICGSSGRSAYSKFTRGSSYATPVPPSQLSRKNCTSGMDSILSVAALVLSVGFLSSVVPGGDRQDGGGQGDRLVAQPDGQTHGEIAADRVAAAGDFLGAVTLGKQPAIGRLHVVPLGWEFVLR